MKQFEMSFNVARVMLKCLLDGITCRVQCKVSFRMHEICITKYLTYVIMHATNGKVKYGGRHRMSWIGPNPNFGRRPQIHEWGIIRDLSEESWRPGHSVSYLRKVTAFTPKCNSLPNAYRISYHDLIQKRKK